MELSLLREFIVLSQTLNYTKAAEILHLTQPTLSKHIVAMEKELGCSLLERDRRRVELTESGNVFAAAALQMVDTYDDAKQRIHDIQTLTPLKVNGIMSDSAIASITSIAATFLDAEGEAPASYNSLNDTNYLEQLVEGDADILLAYAELDKLDNLGLAYIPLIRSPFVAMVSMDSPLASMKSVTMDDLRSYRFVKFADGYSLSGWTNIERVCQEHGYTPRTRAHLHELLRYSAGCGRRHDPAGIHAPAALPVGFLPRDGASRDRRRCGLPAVRHLQEGQLRTRAAGPGHLHPRPQDHPQPWQRRHPGRQRVAARKGKLRSMAKFRMPAASSKSLKRRFGQLSVVSCKPKRRLALYQFSSTH